MNLALIELAPNKLAQGLLSALSLQRQDRLTTVDQADHVICSGGTQAQWQAVIARHGESRVSVCSDDPTMSAPCRSAWSPMPCVGWREQPWPCLFQPRPRWYDHKQREITDLTGARTRADWQTLTEQSLFVVMQTVSPYDAVDSMSRGCIPLSDQWLITDWPGWPTEALRAAQRAWHDGDSLRLIWGRTILNVWWPLTESRMNSRVWYDQWRRFVTDELDPTTQQSP